MQVYTMRVCTSHAQCDDCCVRQDGTPCGHSAPDDQEAAASRCQRTRSRAPVRMQVLVLAPQVGCMAPPPAAATPTNWFHCRSAAFKIQTVERVRQG